MKIDGKALAQAMMRRKENQEVQNESEHDAAKDQLDQGSHIQEMNYFAEAIKNGDHEKAHSHLSKMMDMHMKKDVKEEI